VRDIRVSGAKTADGILVSNVDQHGSRLYFEGLQANAALETGLHVERLTESAVELVDMGHGSTPAVSVKVTDARATIFSGASSNNSLSYEVSGTGDLLVSDMWYEGNQPAGFAQVLGSGRLTIRGSRIAGPADGPTPAIDIVGLEGTVTLIADNIDDRISVTGQSAKGRVLALGLSRQHQTSPLVVNTGGARAAIVNNRQRVERQTLLASGTLPIPDLGEPSSAFLREMLERSRQSVLPSASFDVPDGASDLAFYRVLVDSGRTNVTVTGRARQ